MGTPAAEIFPNGIILFSPFNTKKKNPPAELFPRGKSPGLWVLSEPTEAQCWQPAIGRAPTPGLSAPSPHCNAAVKPNPLTARERGLPSVCQSSNIVVILLLLLLQRRGSPVLVRLFQAGSVFVSFLILEIGEKD